MSKELVIGSNRHETKVAILEEDQLVEVFFQRENEYSLAGSIHKGRVTRVLPGMQSAFVDLGLERDTFLYVSDFFEENEDIDTVSEEKPVRGDRRDRPQNRPGDRASADRISPPQESSEVTPQETEAQERATEVATGEEGLPTGEIAASSEPPEQRTGERVEADRGGFRGDRRGRRSRRRRSRGRGFPENKYAQPGGGESAPRESVEPDSEPEEEVDAPDVIILPGESLAKYRRLASSEGETASQPPQRAGIPAAGGAAADPKDLEAEAEEIELIDKVFSHHDDESPSEVEEKLEEVRQDQPASSDDVASPFVVNDIEAEEEVQSTTQAEPSSDHAVAEVSHVPSVEPLRPEGGPDDRFVSSASAIDLQTTDPDGLHHKSEAIDEPFPGEVPEGQGLSAAELAEDEVPEGEMVEVDEFEASDLEDAQAAAESAVASLEQKQEQVPPGVQSASLREQGGRYMHRVSRRMRRRRGNRFGQQTQDGGQEHALPSGAATAFATQPENRIENRREFSEERSTEKPERVMPSISELLKPGQEIIVQIAKEPLGQKGARITSHIALPGRFVVFMPSVNHLGVSRKIASDEERQRLKRILQAQRVGTTGGFIVRTAGEGVPEDEIAADMDFLYKLWLDIRQKAEKKPAPALLHYDLDIVQRILRDQVTEEFKSIWVDNEDMYENVLSFMQRFQPGLVSRVKMYTRPAPIFDAFNITQELEKALRPKVWLKSGGYIVINQTEALVAIDINTGKYVGKSNRLEDTIVKTNIEAVKEIVRQIRLRDLGGIIVVDFIDMDERKNRQKVMQALEEAMRADRAPYKILQFNDFGLVAITRKRVKQSLERTLCAPCPYCDAAGYVKSVQTIIGEILTEAQKLAKAIEGKDVMLRVHPEVAKVLKANDNKYLEELEEILARPVLVKGDPALHHEKFDLG